MVSRCFLEDQLEEYIESPSLFFMLKKKLQNSPIQNIFTILLFFFSH